jgi:hypothetical protein
MNWRYLRLKIFVPGWNWIDLTVVKQLSDLVFLIRYFFFDSHTMTLSHSMTKKIIQLNWFPYPGKLARV